MLAQVKSRASARISHGNCLHECERSASDTVESSLSSARASATFSHSERSQTSWHQIVSAPRRHHPRVHSLVLEAFEEGPVHNALPSSDLHVTRRRGHVTQSINHVIQPLLRPRRHDTQRFPSSPSILTSLSSRSISANVAWRSMSSILSDAGIVA